ncbi:MAG TPA: sulfur carrier protein ThiS [Candidatus Desulfobacillus sp.]|nr:sulfur carrier protein ThiS [Candidatus Desulfobacillus sp.]
MEISINGERRSVAGAPSVAELLREMGLEGRRLAVERNGEIVPKSAHGATRLAERDRIEIVVAVGGG